MSVSAVVHLFCHLSLPMLLHSQVVRRDGARALFLGLPARCAILGFGSTVFWSIYGSITAALSKE